MCWWAQGLELYFEVQNLLSVDKLIKFSLTNYHGSFVSEEFCLCVLQVYIIHNLHMHAHCTINIRDLCSFQVKSI